MTRPEILQMAEYPAWDQAPLEAAYTVHKYWEADDKEALIAEIAPRVRAIATKGELGASAELIAALPRLEIIGVYGVGYDGVNVDAAIRHGVRVTNTPDVLTDDVADLAVGMWLAHARGMVAADHWVRSGTWGEQGPMALQTRASGKKAGVLGLGRIGHAIAERLVPFGMDIAYWSRSPKEGAEAWEHVGDPVALAERSDVLFLATAANADTAKIVSAEVIKALGPKGVLINISRGSNVDEAALLDALESGALGGAALDVFLNEPGIDPRFFKLDNVLLAPHQGSATQATREAMGQLVRDNLAAHFAGQPLLTPVA